MANTWEKACGKKLKHKKRADAVKHMQSLYELRKAHNKLHVYRCQYCKLWHVGSAEPKTPWEFRAEIGIVENKISAAARGKNFSEAARHSIFKSGLERGLRIYQRLSGKRWNELMEARDWAVYYKVKYESLLRDIEKLANST